MTRETIVLTDFEQPVDRYVTLLRDQGYSITSTDVSLILKKPYHPGGFERVRTILDAQRLPVRLRRSIAAEFDESDYKKSDLVALALPEESVDRLDFEVTCTACGRRYVRPLYDRRIADVSWKRPVVTVNGRVPVISALVRSAIEKQGLTGAVFHPFDEAGVHFYLATSRSLGTMLIRSNEVLGLRRTCGECGIPQWEAYFGPLRYSRADWQGEDFIHSAFEEGPVYSQRACQLLKSFEKQVTQVSPVCLE